MPSCRGQQGTSFAPPAARARPATPRVVAAPDDLFLDTLSGVLLVTRALVFRG